MKKHVKKYRLLYLFLLLLIIVFWNKESIQFVLTKPDYDNQMLQKDILLSNDTQHKKVNDSSTKTNEPRIHLSNVKKIYIEDKNISQEVVPVGVNKKGEMDVKKNADDLFWYERKGKKVNNILIAGHRTWKKKKGKLFASETWEKGLKLTLEFEDGKKETFKLTSKYQYKPSKTPLKIMNTEEGQYRVTLITCTEDGLERIYNIFQRIN